MYQDVFYLELLPIYLYSVEFRLYLFFKPGIHMVEIYPPSLTRLVAFRIDPAHFYYSLELYHRLII